MTLYDRGKPNAFGYRDIDCAEVARAVGSVRIIDVREPSEFDGPLGHVPTAELVPLGTVLDLAKKWNREAELVVVCRSGARSGGVAANLSRLGFKLVMNMTGGMLAFRAGNPLP